MDIPVIVAGVLFLIWPLQYRRSISKIRSRLTGREGQPERFDQAMNRPWMRALLVVAPVLGALFIVLGVTGN